MKQFIRAVICTVIITAVLPMTAYAANPVLESISFSNCKIVEDFSHEEHSYTLLLDDPAKTPMIEGYKINGDGRLTIEYNTDDARHQTGITATVEYDNGTAIYTFDYKNAEKHEKNSNNYLAALECDMCEVYPQINENDTAYKLYIPSDMTELNLTAITEDVSATCDVPNSIKLNDELSISITVTASDASARVYTFDIKRMGKTMAQVKREMAKEGFTSLVEDEMFYRQPTFVIVTASIIGGIMLIIILIAIAKRLTVSVSDSDETEFFAEK